MKIVLDTNVLVSALIKNGKPRTLLSEVVRRKNELILSRAIMEEFARTVANPRIRKYVDKQDVTKFLRDIGSVARIIRIRSRFKVVEEDPDDDIILRTCYDGKAKYVVSGDKHLLKITEFRRIKIVTIDQMLEILRTGD